MITPLRLKNLLKDLKGRVDLKPCWLDLAGKNQYLFFFFFINREQNELVPEYMALSFSLINFHEHIYRFFKAFFQY